ncbi:MAG: hypothetical protein R2824_02365 [Saprospiraceae bacterium]|nr:hypothetical protein [Lewinella sp.]
MPSYTFFNLFANLDPEKLKPFRSFLKKREGVTSPSLLLFDQVRKFYPVMDDERLTLSYLHQKLYGKKMPVREKLVLNQLSDLSGLLRKFLIWEKLNNTPALYDFLELLVLKELNQPELVQRKGMQLEKMLESNTSPTCWELIFRSRLYEEFLKNEKDIPHASNVQILRKLLLALDEGTSAARFKYLASSVKYQEFFSKEGTTGITPDLHPPSALSTAYRLCFQLEAKNEVEVFHRLEAIVRENMTIPAEDRYELLTALINFAARQIKMGQDAYFSKAFELYRFGLESKILLNGSGLTPGKFANIVSLGCHHREFDWTVKFIRQYHPYLPVDKQIQIKYLSLANVKLESGYPKQCINLLSETSFTDVIYHIRYRALLIRALSSLPVLDEERVLQEGRNFRRFLNAQRSIQGHNKVAIVHFIKLTGELIKRKKSKKALIEEVGRLDPVFHKNWIISKLASYRKR